jgi:hypothetical protein
VDINPLAVELAKVSLWLETLALDRPLTFLDAHLRCGNSLVGAPLRDAQGKLSVAALTGIPDEALQEVSKEATAGQKAAARACVKRIQQERKRLQPQRAGQLPLGVDWGVLSLRQVEDALADTLSRRRALERSDEDLTLPAAVALVHEKEQLFDDLQHSEASRYRRATEICNLWCAVWFWPEAGSKVALETEDGEEARTLLAPEPPTTQVFLELAGYLLGTDEGSLPAEERDAYLAVARHVAEEQRFFHWELEFPEVFTRNGGFDAQVGNPPWETVKPNSQEFWSNYDPLFRNLNKQEALRFGERMRANDAVDAAWRGYERSLGQAGQFLKESGQYRNQGRGDTNTYKLFLERSLGLLRTGGGLGMVLPSGLYTDLGSKELRELLLETCQMRYLLAFANERYIFPAVHHAFRFVLLTAERGGGTEALDALFRLNVRNAVAPEELAGLLASPEAATLRLRVSDIRRFSPDSLSLMEFKSQREVDIANAIYGNHPLLGDEVPGMWNVRLTSEFHMTGDSRLFREQSTGWPLYEGRMVNGFDHRVAYWVSGRGRSAVWHYSTSRERFDPNYPWRPQWWLAEGAVDKRMMELYGALAWRIGICDVTASTNERTVVASVLPNHCGAGHSLNACLVTGRDEICATEVVVSIFNSLIFDFVNRFKVVLHASPFLLAQAPLPRVLRDHPTFGALVSRAARLSCTTSEFADLWDTIATTSPDFLPVPWQPTLAATDPRERAQLRAEIDALVADLYGLSEADFAYILTTFPLLDRDQPALPGEPKSFITRDQALLALFELRGQQPPADVVEFFAVAGADIAAVTGPVRGLAERVALAKELGGVAYVPSGRGQDRIENSENRDVETDTA